MARIIVKQEIRISNIEIRNKVENTMFKSV